MLQEKKQPEQGSFFSTLHGALFFGVPSRGMEIDELRAMIRGQPNELLLESLRYGSQTLRDLSGDFRRDFPQFPRIVSFYELEESFSPTKVGRIYPDNPKCVPSVILDVLLLMNTQQDETGKWKMAGLPKKVLVNDTSATDGKAWDKDSDDTYPLNRNHSDLVKFSHYDNDFPTVLEKLTDMVEETLKGDLRGSVSSASGTGLGISKIDI
jgi:hypothetical protein